MAGASTRGGVPARSAARILSEQGQDDVADRDDARWRDARGARVSYGRMYDFRKAIGKARAWQCAWPIAVWVGMRNALTGNSGRFRSHGGWRVSRIVRG